MKKQSDRFRDIPYEDSRTLMIDEDGATQFYYNYFHEYSEYVYNWIAGRIVGNEELVRDLHQETMVKALESRRGLREVEHCKTWLCTIASHVIQDWFRKQKRECSTSLDYLLNQGAECEARFCAGGDLTFNEVIRDFDAKAVMYCLDRLDEKFRYVIRYHHFSDMTFEEIAEKMRENPNTVSSWYYRGCKKLKKLLEEEGGFGKNE